MGPAGHSSIERSAKVEDDTDSDDSNKTSYAACNLVRILANTDEQDEVT